MSWLLANWRVVAALGFAAALAAAVWGVHRSGYVSGRDAANSAIIKQDRSAVDAANEASANRRYCVDAGGVWDITTGKCGRR